MKSVIEYRITAVPERIDNAKAEALHLENQTVPYIWMKTTTGIAGTNSGCIKTLLLMEDARIYV